MWEFRRCQKRHFELVGEVRLFSMVWVQLANHLGWGGVYLYLIPVTKINARWMKLLIKGRGGGEATIKGCQETVRRCLPIIWRWELPLTNVHWILSLALCLVPEVGTAGGPCPPERHLLRVTQSRGSQGFKISLRIRRILNHLLFSNLRLGKACLDTQYKCLDSQSSYKKRWMHFTA